MPDELLPSQRSIPPVDAEHAELTVRILELQRACEEIGHYLPEGRVEWDRLAEFADMLEALTPEIRSLVEQMYKQMVVEGGR